jgi:outer membrane protein TolC
MGLDSGIEIRRGNEARRFERPLLAVTIVALLLSGRSVCAQERVTLPLTLRDAIHLALTEGTAKKLAEDRVAEARLGVDEADAAFRLKLDAFARGFDASLDLETIGFTLPNGERIIGPYGAFESQVRAAISVYDVAARTKRELAERGVEVSGFEVKRVENGVAAAVAKLYTLAQKTEAQIAAHEAAVTLFERLLQVAQDQHAAGVATRIDLTRAEAQLAREQQALLVARSQRDAIRLALLHALGADQSSEIVLLDPLSPAENVAPLDESLRVARERRPELAVLDARLRQAGAGIDTAKALRMPVLSLQAQAGYSGYHMTNLDLTRTVAALVTVPIYTGGLIETQIGRATLMVHEVELARSEAERQIEEDVRRAQLGFETARSRVALAGTNVRLAEEELELSRDRFVNGVANGMEVDNAQTSFVAAKQDQIAALADQRQAELDLARATGAIRALIEPAENPESGK